jgi:endonuclease/exonuclease/phosphatase family metal-dependent hydrolase
LGETPPESNVLQVVQIQELNPLDRRLEDLKNFLGAEGAGFAINVGLRAGSLSYPFLLQEGLATLWRGSLKNIQTQSQTLSGKAVEFRGPFGIAFALQLAERRGALAVTGEWQGKRWTFVNLHLHAGNPNSIHSERRTQEMKALMDWLKPHLDTSDVVIIAGDFNCEVQHSELDGLKEAGFEPILDASGKPIPTWDGSVNEIARNSVLTQKDPAMQEWDKVSHQIDHVFFRVKGPKPAWTFKTERIFDKPLLGLWPSDHYGILVDISWTNDALQQ